jgi:DNA-binding HxlR family transcriptional regulator
MKGQDHSEFSGCPLACTLDILGDRWTLLIVRELMFNNKHEYKDFMAMPERISTNILADRLKKLQERGVIKSFPHPEIKSRKIYYLTAMGKELIHVIVPLVLWGVKHLKDVVKVPPEKQKYLKNPQHLIDGTLTQIQLWESANLPASKV